MANSTHFPHPYYFYGSADSTDTDIMIAITPEIMPTHQHERKALVKILSAQIDFSCNATLIVIKNGFISDTIYPKAWIDSLNNSLWHTYALHPQIYPNPLKGELPRCYLLAIYKAVRTVLTMLTRTHYRSIIKPYLKGIHPFEYKIRSLKQIDFQSIQQFKQKNTSDQTAWKIIAFYIGQNMALLKHNHQIYSKQALIQHYPLLHNFIYRQAITQTDIHYLNQLLKEWIVLIESWGIYNSEGALLSCRGEQIDMTRETY